MGRHLPEKGTCMGALFLCPRFDLPALMAAAFNRLLATISALIST